MHHATICSLLATTCGSNSFTQILPRVPSLHQSDPGEGMGACPLPCLHLLSSSSADLCLKVCLWQTDADWFPEITPGSWDVSFSFCAAFAEPCSEGMSWRAVLWQKFKEIIVGWDSGWPAWCAVWWHLVELPLVSCSFFSQWSLTFQLQSLARSLKATSSLPAARAASIISDCRGLYMGIDT